MIIIDTNVLSEPLRPRPDPSVVTWLDAQVVETLFLTTITLAEIRYGIAALPRGRRRTSLAHRFESDLLPIFEHRILAFDESASLEYAELRASAQAGGHAVGDFDALIASIARAHGFGVASRDVSPFVAAGVTPLINPFD